MRKLGVAVFVVLTGLAIWWLTPAEVPLARSGPRLTTSLEREWPTTSPAREAAFSRDGALLATSNAAGDILIRRTSDWRAIRTLQVPGGATSLVFAPDSGRLFTAGYDGIVRAWHVADGRLMQQYKGASGTIWTLDVRPDGGELAEAGEDGVIRLWDVQTGSARTLKGHERNIWEVHYSSDGKRLASAGFDTTTRLWRADGSPIRLLRGHSEAVVGMDLSPDGRLIATGSDDSTLRLWRTDTGQPLRIIDARNHVYGVDFSSDGRWILTAGRARGGPGTLWHQLTGLGGSAAPVHIWRASDGRAVAALPHGDDVMYATFSPDMRHVVTSGEQGVRLWRIGKP